MAKKPKIIVSRKLPGEVETRISTHFDALLNPDDHVVTAEEVVEKANGCDALLVTPAEKFTAPVMARIPASVKIVATFSVGYDHLDVPAARARGLVLTNTPDVLTDATADIAMLLILGAARGAFWGERMVREQRWTSWSPTHPLGYDVSGRRLGILGMGRIGQALAKRAAAFDMKIHYFNRHRVEPAAERGAVFHSNLESLLPNADFLSVNCASTPETRGMINAAVIEQLPAQAIVVNSARGDIINDDDLIAALKSGRLAAAGLDVYRNEPNIDARFRELDNVFLLPHLGSATRNTRIAMGMRAVDNLEQYFAGSRPQDQLT